MRTPKVQTGPSREKREITQTQERNTYDGKEHVPRSDSVLVGQPLRGPGGTFTGGTDRDRDGQEKEVWTRKHTRQKKIYLRR